MIDPYAFLGIPFNFKNICMIYPPKIQDVLGELNYPVYKKVLLSSQEDIEDEYTEQKKSMDEVPTPFEYVFQTAALDPRIKQIILDGFQFFIKEPVLLLHDKKLIIVGNLEETLQKAKSIEDLKIITENNYFEFQNCLRRAIGEKAIEPYNPNENPRIRYFKAKARLRDRIKAKSKDGLNLGSTLASICCMDVGISPLNAGELSQAAITVLMRYYQEKQKYDIDIRSLLAGADSKKVKPQFWIRNIEDL